MAAAANQSMNRNNSPYEVEPFTPFDSFNFEPYSGYPKLVEFVRSYFATRKLLFNPLKSLYDPFIQGITVADGKKMYTNFYKWYVEKNPTFGSKKDLYIPEYEIALVQICRDLLFVHSRGKYIISNNARRKIENLRKTRKNSITRANINKLIANNITELKSKFRTYQHNEVQKKTYGITNINNSSKRDISVLLKFIEDNLSDDEVYKYKNFLKILYDFLQIMSCGAPGQKLALDSGLDEFMEYFLNFPLLIYPTYMQINFKNVVLLAASPVINFRLTNRFRFVHDENFPPIGEMEHDLFFHGKYSHNYDTLYKDTVAIKYFIVMNKFIQLLKPHFDYDEKDASLYLEIESNENILVITNEQQQPNEKKMEDNQQMVCYCLLLFNMIHELNFGSYLYVFLQNYLKRYNTVEDLNKELNGQRQSVDTKKLFRAINIFKENNDNKAAEKFPFLKHIDYKNVFINFILLLYKLKDNINEND